MNVTHRIIEYAKHLRLSVSAFEASIDQAGRLQAAKQNDRNPNTDLLEKISEKYSDLNMNWVISGKGEMLLTEGKSGAPAASNDAELTKRLLQAQQDLIDCMKQNNELKESSAGVKRTTTA